MLEVILFLLAGIAYAFWRDLNLLELLMLAGLAVAVRRGIPLAWDRLQKTEAWLARFAQQPARACLAVVVTAWTVRLLLLPLLPAPTPFVPDEFSHLLLADTFLHGRLANPPHPLWPHFETIHVLARPTYSSMYLPAQGLLLALGQAVFGQPWWGVWLLSGVLCGAFCWALQAWLPLRWALYGGLLAILRFGVASYWVNSYWGGALAALGGALVTGATGRLRSRLLVRDALCLALGWVLLASTRPYEGLLFSIAMLAPLAASWHRRRLSWRTLLQRAGVPVLLVMVPFGAAMMSYCRHVTGSSLVLPYQENQRQYGWPLTLAWVPVPKVQHRHLDLRRYYEFEQTEHETVTSPLRIVQYSSLKLQPIWGFYVGPVLSLALCFLPQVWRSRMRPLCLGAAVVLAAVLTESASVPHYFSPAAVCLLGVVVQGLRHVRVWRYRGQPAGRLAVQLAPVMLAVLLVTSIAAKAVYPSFGQYKNYLSWCCITNPQWDRPKILARLQRLPGQHLVIVQAKDDPYNTYEWVYNSAAIDQAKVVWARDMGEAGNAELIRYFPGRQVWWLDPNQGRGKLTLRQN